MKITKAIGIGALSLFAANMALATNWEQDVPVGSNQWSNAASWSLGIPSVSNSAIIINTQANTYDIDVDSTVPATRLIQVGQEYSFTGAGELTINRSPAAHFENLMYNTTAGGTVTYNVPVTINTDTEFYAQMKHTASGITVFNDAFTLSSGSKLNADGGTFTFNGDLTLDGTFRLGATKIIIGGSGTTTMDADYMLTSSPGSELHLNRPGAYTPKPGTGYLRVEKSKVYFNAPEAVSAGTLVRMFELDPSAALVSGGDYDQDFGLLYCQSTVNNAIIDMQNTACMWTFADCSSLGWGAPGIGLSVVNVDVSNTVIRFKIDGGTGLTTTQIDRTKVNGVDITEADVTIIGGYLYITQATSVPVDDIVEPAIVSSSLEPGNIVKIVVDAPSAVDRYWPEASANLVGGTWTNVAHSYTNDALT
ncbi:MAG: hypothetical protein U9P12_10315, partial [Verrucomicrobiota bacterium]|nr:hypothetical protein [Verrucomicrobiota bacterium]